MFPSWVFPRIALLRNEAQAALALSTAVPRSWEQPGCAAATLPPAHSCPPAAGTRRSWQRGRSWASRRGWQHRTARGWSCNPRINRYHAWKAAQFTFCLLDYLKNWEVRQCLVWALPEQKSQLLLTKISCLLKICPNLESGGEYFHYMNNLHYVAGLWIHQGFTLSVTQNPDQLDKPTGNWVISTSDHPIFIKAAQFC